MTISASLPAIGIRAVQCICARDRADGQQHRRSALSEQARYHTSRAARLSRTAASERARAVDLQAEVR